MKKSSRCLRPIHTALSIAAGAYMSPPIHRFRGAFSALIRHDKREERSDLPSPEGKAKGKNFP